MINVKKSIFIFCIACAFTLLSVFLQVAPSATSGYIEQTFSISSPQVVNLSALYFLAYAILQIPNGIFLDKFGFNKVLPIGLLITIIGSILYWLSPNALFIGISRSIIGAGCSIAYIGAVFIAAKSFKPRYLPVCIAIVEMTSTFGAILAENTYASIMKTFGWDISNIIVILIAAIIFGLLLFLLREPTHKTLNNDRHIPWNSLLSSIRSILKNKIMIGIFAYSFFSWGIIMSFAGFWAKNYFEKMHHFTEDASLTLAEIYWLSFLISALLISIFAKSKNTIKISIIILPIIGVMSYSIMCMPILFNYNELVIFSITSGLSAAGVVLAFSLIPYFINHSQIGIAIALNNTFIVLGGFFAQIIFGVIIELPIKYNVTFFIQRDINLYFYNGLLLLAIFSVFSLLAIIITVINMSKHESLMTK